MQRTYSTVTPGQKLRKIKNLVELYARLPEEEKLIVDVLRHIIIETLPAKLQRKDIV